MKPEKDKEGREVFDHYVYDEESGYWYDTNKLREAQDGGNSKIDKDDYWYGPSEVKGSTSTFTTNGLNNDQEEMQSAFDDYKERYNEHNSMYQYNNNNYGSDTIFGSDDALNKRPYINHQGHTYYKDTNPDEYNYYKEILNNKVKNGVTAGGYYIPTVTVTSKKQEGGSSGIDNNSVDFPELRLDLLDTEDEVDENNPKPLGYYDDVDPIFYDEDNNAYYSPYTGYYMWNPLKEQMVVRGRSEEDQKMYDNKSLVERAKQNALMMAKRAAEVQMRKEAGNAGRNFGTALGDTWKYRQYITTGKGLVPNVYNATHGSWSDSDAPVNNADGSDIIDLELYGNIDPDYGFVEDDDYASYKKYIDEDYGDKRVKSYTYHPDFGSYRGEYEGDPKDLTLIYSHPAWQSVDNIDTAHDRREWATDKDGNIYVRGTDVIDYNPKDYVKNWSLNNMGERVKSYIQSKLLDEVTTPFVIKTAWGYPQEFDGSDDPKNTPTGEF